MVDSLMIPSLTFEGSPICQAPEMLESLPPTGGQVSRSWAGMGENFDTPRQQIYCCL